MTVQWRSRNGNKIISRRFLTTGSYIGNPRGYKSRVIATLPGYDMVSGSSSECVLQGIADGCIHPDVKVYGIENQPTFWDGIEAHAHEHGIDMTLHRGDFKTFVPPRKLDHINVDLMCGGQGWIGTKLVCDIVPNMKSRRSSIGVNLNIQRATSLKHYDELVDEYFANQKEWDSIWKRNPQSGKITRETDKNPFTGVYEAGFDALITFMGIHKEMRETNFMYRGCYRYTEKSSATAGTQYMLSLRYERQK